MPRRSSSVRTVRCLAGALAAALVAPALAADTVASDPLPALRVVDDGGKTVALEIAARDFRPSGGEGPVVCLVGVSHIGDRSFYRELQRLLDACDVVLYESVMPAGAAGAGGETDTERVESTRAAMEYVVGLVELYRARHERYPASTEVLSTFAAEADARLAEWLAAASVDAWGKTLHYAALEEGGSFRLSSLGADGREGGVAAAADLILSPADGIAPMTAGGEGNLQAELASALGLAFQLEAVDYDRAHWRCSDMAIDQVQRALDARDVDFDVVGGALAGTTLPARIATVLLRAIRFLDSFTDGAIADTAKVMLIEMIGDESMTRQALQQFGKGFTEVIVEQRNQVAIDDLKEVLEADSDLGHVAIFYGAAHMPDLAERLADQLGYEPADERWFRAIEVDLTTSAVDRRQLQQMRLMMRQMMQQQMQR